MQASFKSFAPTVVVALWSALSLTACGGSDEVPTAALEAHASLLAAPLPRCEPSRRCFRSQEAGT
jgi:hypothetical protein